LSDEGVRSERPRIDKVAAKRFLSGIIHQAEKEQKNQQKVLGINNFLVFSQIFFLNCNR